MKQLFFVLFLAIGSLNLNAQNTAFSDSKEVNVGEILEIGNPESSVYKHIDFPRANFIIKKGGIANYKNLEGYRVIVTSVIEKKDGTVTVKIKRADGQRFFGSHVVVSANLQDALESGELRGI